MFKGIFDCIAIVFTSINTEKYDIQYTYIIKTTTIHWYVLYIIYSVGNIIKVKVYIYIFVRACHITRARNYGHVTNNFNRFNYCEIHVIIILLYNVLYSVC